MDRLTREQIAELAEARPHCAVSLYMPTHRSGPDTRPFAQEDVVGWKNLLRTARERLDDRGVTDRDAERLLAPARQLLDQPEFWQYLSDGLAVFAADDFFRVFRAPERFDPLVWVGTRFHVIPLSRVMAGDDRFYILALSQGDVRLIEAGRASAEEVDLATAPRSLRDALRFDVPDRHQQFRTLMAAPAGGGGRGTALFHGHGVDMGDGKDNILQFCHQVDRGVRDLLHASNAPLVLAAVEYVASIYRRANHYPHLIEQGLTGNYEGVKAGDLQRQAWPLVEPYVRDREAAALARYWQAVATDRTTRELSDILTAAADGRVEALFLQEGAARWGRFDEETRRVEHRDRPENGDENLLNEAAARTLLNGGLVHLVPPQELPDPAGALLRY